MGVMSMQCTKCQANISDGVKFCPKCGTPAQIMPNNDTKNCPKCGMGNPVNAKFCKNDGYRFDSLATISGSSPTTHTNAKGKVAPNRVTCPQCGTENSDNAKFCKKDGFALQGGTTPTPTQEAKSAFLDTELGNQYSAHQDEAIAKTTKKPNKVSLMGLLASIVLVAIIGSGYAYWKGYIGNRQGTVQKKINAELIAKGLENVKIAVDQDWNASLSGNVPKQADKDLVQELTKTHEELKNITFDMVQVLPNTVDLRREILGALSSNGLTDQTVIVSDEFSATISGSLKSADQRRKAISIAESVTGVKSAIYKSTALLHAPEITPMPESEPKAATIAKPIQAPSQKLRNIPVATRKEPAITNQPTVSKPEPEIQAELPNNNTTHESGTEADTKKPASTISESWSELRDKLKNIEKLEVRPITKEEQDKKFCPIPGQSC